jgi:hypothetical protein
MFEDIIAQLESMGVDFEEMPEQNSLSVNVSQMDKAQLIEVLNMVYSMGMTVGQLDESVMMIGNPTPVESEPDLEPVAEEETEEDAAQMAALDEAMSGM